MWLENFYSDFENNEIASLKLLEIIELLQKNGEELSATSLKKLFLSVIIF